MKRKRPLDQLPIHLDGCLQAYIIGPASKDFELRRLPHDIFIKKDPLDQLPIYIQTVAFGAIHIIGPASKTFGLRRLPHDDCEMLSSCLFIVSADPYQPDTVLLFLTLTTLRTSFQFTWTVAFRVISSSLDQ